LNTYILIYDSFVQFEVTLAAYFMKTQGEVYTLGLEHTAVTSCEGFSVNPTVILENVDVSSIDLFIIPGGDIDEIAKHEALLTLIRRLNDAGVIIGGICGGVSLLKTAGVLDSNLDQSTDSPDANVIINGNIITAKPNGYVDFALEIGKKLSIFKDEADLQETIDFFKYFKSV
jgi:putative intracellular protease/amidase